MKKQRLLKISDSLKKEKGRMTGSTNGNKQMKASDSVESPVILHLSDLHFGYDEGRQGAARRKLVLDELIKVVSTQQDEWLPNIICITGDVAMRAAASDYEQAEEWLGRLMEVIEIGSDNVVICLGNHDVDRKVAQGDAPPVDSQTADRLLSYDYFRNRCEPFKEFVRFCKKVGFPHFAIGKSKSYCTGIRTVNRIRFVCCNSAWFSQQSIIDGKPTDDHRLWLGLPLLQFLESERRLPRIDTTGSCPITIILFHHPFALLHFDETNRSSQRQSTREFLSYRSHIILTGHEHGGITDPDILHGRPYHFKAGATYDNPDYRNNFRLIRIEENYLRYRAFESDPTSATDLWSMVEESKPKFFWNVSEQIIKAHFEQKHKGAIERINQLLKNIESSIYGANYEEAKKQSDDLDVLLDKPEIILSVTENQEVLLKYIDLLDKLFHNLPEDAKQEIIVKAEKILKKIQK